MTSRRDLLKLTLGGLVAAIPAGAVLAAQAQKGPDDVEIWKTPTCGCCHLWVEHMRVAGFKPTVHDVPDTAPYRAKAGVPQSLGSCHTALVAGYALEGHVPADLVRKAIKEKARIAGLAVPGMPMGSPGMEQGTRKDRYDIIAFTKDGKTSVYATR
jgi:hypothetical protein